MHALFERLRVEKAGLAAADYKRFVDIAHAVLPTPYWETGMTGTGVAIWFPAFDTEEKLASMYKLDYVVLGSMDDASIERWLTDIYDTALFWHRMEREVE